jgi:cephalosporin-C deacetylase
MPIFDLPLEELKLYKPPRVEESDFDNFWQATLSESNQFPLDPHFELVDYGLHQQKTYDVTYAGFSGQPIKAWLLLPSHRSSRVPCIVEYIGYGGGRGFPIDWLLWSSVGYAHLIMDTRGQGSTWQKGDTPDLYAVGGNPSIPGFMTQGILNPRDYYYRRVFTDAVRAVETARNHPAIDPDHIAITGGSQGGGITLAAAGLIPSLDAAMPDVPFLCHYRRATELVGTYPYQEISEYCTYRIKLINF